MPLDENEKIILKAGDISRPLISIDQQKTLLDLRDIILKYNIRRIGISSNEKIIGIVTEKDLFNFLYMNSSDRRSLDEIPVMDLLKKPNELILVDKDASIQFCAKSMLNNKISSLLVTSDEDQIKDIITKTDLVEIFAYHYSGFFSVKECMTKKVVTAAPDDNINLVYGLMHSHKISRVVIAKDDFPVGIITPKDFFPASIFYGINFASNKFPSPNSHMNEDEKSKFKISDIKSFLMSSDIMTARPLLMMDEDDDVAEAARIMIRHRISGLPVINSEMTLTGIVTKTDIIKTIIRI